MTDRSDTHNESRGWLARLFDARMPQLVQSMRHEAFSDYRALLHDFDAPMAPSFEREVARTLNQHGERDLIPAKTLMPAMMQRFDLTAEDYAPEEARHFHEMQAVCNRCPVAGRCWRAMRAGASWEQCRGFCPNAEAFEHKSLEAAG